jgi:hypothetical protein
MARIVSQQRGDKNKVHSLHAPETSCIAKGKAHKKYEFGSKALNHSGAWEVLLNQINSQLTGHGVLVKQGAIVDASVPPLLCVSLKGRAVIP